VRAGSDRSNLEGLEVALIEGDLADGEIPRAFTAGADLVIHLAALYAEGTEQTNPMFAVNVMGTGALLGAACAAGVPRFLHCSTMGTCAPTSDGEPATEADRIDLARTSAYHLTKVAGEDLASRTEGIDVVIVNPAAPVGAFDLKPTVTGQKVRDVVEGRWPRLLAGPVNHVSARGCAEGIVAAAEHGRPGERYLLGGEELAPEAFIERVAQAASVPPPRRSLWMRLCRKGRWSPGSFRIDDGKARRELGYDPGDLDDAFREAASWFKRQR
jgi:dihydroflavonol-4-reductase